MSDEASAGIDDVEQMAAALAELRSARAEGGDSTVDVPQFAAVGDASTAQSSAANAGDSNTDPSPQASQADGQAQKDGAPVEDPQERLKAVQAELHKAQSELGRVGALNRKYMQAQQEAQELRAQLAQAHQVAPSAAVQDSSQALARLQEVASQVKDFPELAGIVAAVGDAINQATKQSEEVARRVAAQAVEPLEPLRRDYQTRAQTEQQAAIDAALQTFHATYPSAPQVIELPEFKTWIANQPQHLQWAYFRGETPMDALTVMDAYDMHLRRSGRDPIAQIPIKPAADAGSTQRPTAKTDTSRLQRAAVLPSRSMGAQGGMPAPDDFEGSLAYFRAQRLRQAA